MPCPKQRVAVLQSNYIPWKGYFDLIGRVDTFVFYDDVQYTKNDWRNRNLIKTLQGPHWLTVPVGSTISRSISDVVIPNPRWQTKHLASIRQSYTKAPYFHEYQKLLELIYVEHEWTSLSELNQFIIRKISQDYLNLSTQFCSSVDFHLNGDRNTRLLQLLTSLNTSTYLTGPSAKSYLDEQAFRSMGITVEYIDYSHYPQYHQLFPPFSHQVSILDTLLCMGPETRHCIWPRTSTT